MATPRELIRAVAEALGVPEPTVVVHDRNLALAGLRTMAGRGRAAAKMTATDAANLVVATAGSMNVKDSAKTVTNYGALQADRRGVDWIGRYFRLGEKHSFSDAVTSLLEAAAHDEIDHRSAGGSWDVEVHLFEPLVRARIVCARRVQESRHVYDVNYRLRRSHSASAKAADLERQSTFTHMTILWTGRLIGGLK
jgi:hypothetical protein